MYKIRYLLASLLLSSCSTQSVQPLSNTHSTITNTEISLSPALPAPDLTQIKAGKILKLTRIMEGGACKNKQQGATGLFRLYTNPDDIQRIKQYQGSGVFAGFEVLIKAFSMRALQQAIDHVDFQTDAYALNEIDTQRKLADQLINLFIDLIADDIANFETETTLMIDVSPLPDSLTIYLNGCETPHKH